MVRLEVKHIVSGNLDHDDGEKLFQKLLASLDQGSVTLDFSGMDVVTPSFLNTSFIPLFSKYDYSYLRNNLDIENANSLIVSLIKKSIDVGLKSRASALLDTQ